VWPLAPGRTLQPPAETHVTREGYPPSYPLSVRFKSAQRAAAERSSVSPVSSTRIKSAIRMSTQAKTSGSWLSRPWRRAGRRKSSIAATPSWMRPKKGARRLQAWKINDDSAFDSVEAMFRVEVEAQRIIDSELFRGDGPDV
jgi:hypothetical protein